MTSQDDRKEQLTELRDLLDTWGGEPARWPPKVRLRIAALSQSHAGRQLLDEASAFDRLLDKAGDASSGVPPARTRALADRIMAAAQTDAPAPVPARNAEVVQLPLRKPVPASKPAQRPVSAFASQRWHAAGLLAASLLAGIYIGGSVNIAPVFQELADAVGITQGVDATLPGLGDELDDEETL